MLYLIVLHYITQGIAGFWEHVVNGQREHLLAALLALHPPATPWHTSFRHVREFMLKMLYRITMPGFIDMNATSQSTNCASLIIHSFGRLKQGLCNCL